MASKESHSADATAGRKNLAGLDPWFPDDTLIAWMQTGVVTRDVAKLLKATKTKKMYKNLNGLKNF